MLKDKLERLAEDAQYVSTIVATRPEDASELMRDLARRLRELTNDLHQEDKTRN